MFVSLLLQETCSTLGAHQKRCCFELQGLNRVAAFSAVHFVVCVELLPLVLFRYCDAQFESFSEFFPESLKCSILLLELSAWCLLPMDRCLCACILLFSLGFHTSFPLSQFFINKLLLAIQSFAQNHFCLFNNVKSIATK